MTLLSIPRPSVYGSQNNKSDYSDFLKRFAHSVDSYAESCKNYPLVNIIEEPKQFRIIIAAPGYDKKDFSISTEKDQLIIEAYPANNNNENLNFLVREHEVCSFKRSFTMGKSVDSSKIDANYNQGVLTLTLAKREEAIEKPPRTISVS